MDRRSFRSNGRMAHSSLKGHVDHVAFSDGTVKRICVPVANLLNAPDGPLDRQLIHGDAFCVLEDTQGWSFGYAEPSGYVGYIHSDALGQNTQPTHRVTTFGAHVYPKPSIKTIPIDQLPFNATVTAQKNGTFYETATGFIPKQQLSDIGALQSDTAKTAARFVGVPYLWGGDTNLGIDCSGLVHATLSVAGKECPRDSDQQAAFFAPLPLNTPLERGDLVFWDGHVGIMHDQKMMVHANGHHMATTIEPLDIVAKRIKEIEGKDILSYARV